MQKKSLVWDTSATTTATLATMRRYKRRRGHKRRARKKSIVNSIGALVGCQNDWEMFPAVRKALKEMFDSGYAKGAGNNRPADVKPSVKVDLETFAPTFKLSDKDFLRGIVVGVGGPHEPKINFTNANDLTPEQLNKCLSKIEGHERQQMSALSRAHDIQKQYRINVVVEANCWRATMSGTHATATGCDPSLAIVRCFVAYKLGRQVAV